MSEQEKKREPDVQFLIDTLRKWCATYGEERRPYFKGFIACARDSLRFLGCSEKQGEDDGDLRV